MTYSYYVHAIFVLSQRGHSKALAEPDAPPS